MKLYPSILCHLHRQEDYCIPQGFIKKAIISVEGKGEGKGGENKEFQLATIDK